MLAAHGYQPILLERGADVDQRTKDVEAFWENGQLNLSSNVQFGEGGAGTFSDGKLNTLVKTNSDATMKYYVSLPNTVLRNPSPTRANLISVPMCSLQL